MTIAQPGTVTAAMIPSPVPEGMFETANVHLDAAGFAQFISWSTGGFPVSDLPTVQAVLSGYVGSADHLAWWKRKWQDMLDDGFDRNFDFRTMVRMGTSTATTATSVGNFLSAVVNNYRSLRASIAAAATVAAVQSINVLGGWPANP